MLKTTKHNVLNDQIVATLKLDKKDLPSTEKYTTTRDEVKAFINELKPNFGSPIAFGVTLDNIELNPIKDVVTITFGIHLMTKSDIDEMSVAERVEFIAEMRSASVESVKNMASFSAMKRCMDEGYTIIINCCDIYKQQLFSCALGPDDYK